MKLYNTLNRQVEDIKPIDAPTVTIYTCGPTVYDYPHIGNWFTFIRYDILIRTLTASGYKPKWVMNITDVGHLVSDADEGEDKLEKGARREGKTAWDVAKFYTDYFVGGLKRLNFMPPTYLPKATDHIIEQIEFVKKLEAKGYAYVINDGVYYDTSKFPHYADFAQLDIDEQQAGKRVDFNPEKRHSTDFALWKFSPKGQKRDMEWDSPWGKGFPGWHLECSAMAIKYLGDTIDIHTGGIDHVPVHHTNEIAQSEAATGKPFAHYWMHSNHILIEGEKIAKSTGNGITLEDIEAKSFDLEALRLLVLQSHYRSQSKFSWDELAAAQNRLNDLRAMAALRWQAREKISDADIFVSTEVVATLEAYLADDLNTPLALSYLSQVSAGLNTTLLEKEPDDPYNGLPGFMIMLERIDDLLGLRLTDIPDITPEQTDLIRQREGARSSHDWVKADELRHILATQKIGVRDTSSGPIWFPL